jgi:hypothetical protein
MTEAEWLATKLPTHMISSGLDEWDDRKAFLAGSHCLRHWWYMLTDLQKVMLKLWSALRQEKTPHKKHRAC